MGSRTKFGNSIAIFAIALIAAMALQGAPQTSRRVPPTHRYAISPAVSIELPAEWAVSASAPTAPPSELTPYAPAFHLSGITTLVNASQNEVLQFAASDNPLAGHDSNWLDGQMHATSGTGGTGAAGATVPAGGNLLNYLFYYFFGPPPACLEDLLNHSADATRVPEADDHPPGIQVFHACHFSATLLDFFASQLSSGVAFRQTTDGPTAFGAFNNFYVAPMQQADISSMTFFIFEAQRTDPVGSDAAAYFHLPDNFQGGHADYFSAIGAPSPFPFVDDSRAKTVPIIHITFAAGSPAPGRAADFTRLLQQVRLRPSG